MIRCQFAPSCNDDSHQTFRGALTYKPDSNYSMTMGDKLHSRSGELTGRTYHEHVSSGIAQVVTKGSERKLLLWNTCCLQRSCALLVHCYVSSIVEGSCLLTYKNEKMHVTNEILLYRQTSRLPSMGRGGGHPDPWLTYELAQWP